MEHPSKPMSKLTPFELPLSVKTLLDLQKHFDIAEVHDDKIIESLKYEGENAELMRRFAYEKIVEHTKTCKNCSLPLYDQHTQSVPGEGSIRSPLMLIGEGPGADEDREGRPFVGKAGQLLTTILEKLEIDRNKVYITNVIKCRPPGNRTPLKGEIEACSKILRLELDIVAPKVIIALGAIPLKSFNVEGGIIRARGKWVKYQDDWVMPTFHPAYILRQHGKALVRAKWDVWYDFNAALEKVKELCPDYIFK